jgi:hypothetical protein
MYLNRCIAAGLTAAALAFPAASMAAQPDDGEHERNNACQGAAATPKQEPEQAISQFGKAAQPAQLEHTRGGDGGAAIDTRLSGTVTGNTATNVATGANIIQSGSFANASGVPIVIQNTGANVLIQNATVINLQLK